MRRAPSDVCLFCRQSFVKELEEVGGHKWLGEMLPMTDWKEKKALLTKVYFHAIALVPRRTVL